MPSPPRYLASPASSCPPCLISHLTPQVFRKATNGPAYLDRARALFGLRIDLVSHEIEAELGYQTAVTLATLPTSSSETMGPAETVAEAPTGPLLVWDSGGASFQITTRAPASPDSLVAAGASASASASGPPPQPLQAYLGCLGSGVVGAMMLAQVAAARSTINPVSHGEAETLIGALIAQLPPCPPWLRDAHEVLALYGLNCAFRLVGDVLTHSSEPVVGVIPAFDLPDVEQALLGALDKSDAELAFLSRGDPAGLVVPKLCLLAAIMRHTGLRRVQPVRATGSCAGLLAMAQFWPAPTACGSI